MRVLFDQGVPAPLRKKPGGCDVKTAFEMGWSDLENGALLAAAEAAQFAIFLTTDKNLRFQQNLTGRQIAVDVLSTTSWPRIQTSLAEIVAALSASRKGSFVMVEID